MVSLFDLAPDGVCPAADVATSAVSSCLAISTLPDPLARPSAVYFLWHFPSPHGVRSLTGILLCGARTFLSAHEARSDCLASFDIEFNTGILRKSGNPDFGYNITCCASESPPQHNGSCGYNITCCASESAPQQTRSRGRVVLSAHEARSDCLMKLLAI